MSSTYFSAWSVIKHDILDGLYGTQIRFWNNKLAKLIQKNGQFQGVIIPEAMAAKSAIQQGSHSWTALPINWLEVSHDPEYHFSLFPDSPDLEEDLIKISHELAKIKKERYESDRFLSGMVMYVPTSEELREILGDNLYSLVNYKVADTTTDILAFNTLEHFLEINAHILEHMQERVLLNLLMSEIVR
jgi:hypothetical protein